MADPLATNDDDIQLQSPQDDVQTSGDDLVTEEMTDRPADDYGIPEKELKEELDNRIINDEGGEGANNEARFDADDALNEEQDRDEDSSNEIGR